MRKLQVITSLFLGLFLVTGCGGPKEDYSGVIRTADSLRTEVIQAKERFDQLDHQVVLDALKKMNDEIQSAPMVSGGNMTEEEAVLFGEYGRARRLLKDYPQRFKRINNEAGRTVNQLEQFSKMLQDRADVDQQGNKIDRAYVNKNLMTEKRVAEELVLEIDETIDYATRGIQQFEDTHPRIAEKFAEWRAEYEQ